MAVALLLVAPGSAAHAQDRQCAAPAATPKNLQVLTPEVNLAKVMESFNTGLGVQCTYCHVAGDCASDANPKKATSRQMLRMLKQVNLHFPDAGNDFLNSKYMPFPEGKQYVTCYTCHRGAAVPATTIPNWHGPDRAPEPGVPPPNPNAAGRGRGGRGGGRGAGAANTASPDGGGLEQSAAADRPASRGNQMHKNMVFLPSDTDTTLVMPAFRAAIGVECNFCHVAGAQMERGHANERDLDLNPKKLIARNMIGMLKEINAELFPQEEIDLVYAASSIPPDGKHYVTCYTCHRGSRFPLTEPAAAAAR